METYKGLDCLLRFHVTDFDNNICGGGGGGNLIYHKTYKDFIKFLFAGIAENCALLKSTIIRTAKYVLYIISQYQTRLKNSL